MRGCLTVTVTLIIRGGLAFLANSEGAESAVSDSKPNFVIFQPDDFPFYWDDAPTPPPSTRPRQTQRNPTPYLDKIRSEGVVFARAYAASAMCAPSRFAVLTGRYASRSKTAQDLTASCDNTYTLTDVVVPKSKMDDGFDETNNLQQALRFANYTTGAVGKWHISTEGRDPWTVDKYSEHAQKAKDTGFDYVDGFYVANLDSDGTLPFSHNQEWVTEKGLEFVEGAVSQGKPFFLYFNPTLPHSPSAVDALEMSIRETPAGTLPQDPVSTMPDRASVAERAGGDSKTDRSVSAVQVDDAAGALYDKLHSLGVLNNTMFVFIMDHGMLGKSTLTEAGVRIAMFARFPAGGERWDAGSVYHNMVSNLDLAPTIVHLATETAPSDDDALDGVSFLDMDLSVSAQDALSADPRALVVELAKDRAVVTQQWKYLQSEIEGYADSGARTCLADEAVDSSEAEQLFDLTLDDTEQTNVISSADASVVSAMRARLACHVTATAIGAAPQYGTCADPLATDEEEDGEEEEDGGQKTAVVETGGDATTTTTTDATTDATMTTPAPSTDSEPDAETTTTPEPEEASWPAEVRAVVVLPYSTESFPRDAFVRGVAAAAGVAARDVRVNSVRAVAVRRGIERLERAGGRAWVRRHRLQRSHHQREGREGRRASEREGEISENKIDRGERRSMVAEQAGGVGMPGRVGLRSERVDVDFSVRAASAAEAQALVDGGGLGLEALSTALESAGVQGAMAVKTVPYAVAGVDVGTSVGAQCGARWVLLLGIVAALGAWI